ncbi:MAG TPA: glycosyltransferase family 1 protein, partial [Chitinophagales bacterium]|nr:glycosyltransferase family 1 protein [Chitinophagales bacterium]
MRIGVNARFLLKDKMEGIGVFTDEICKRLVKLMPEHTFYFYFDRDFDLSFIYSENIIGKKVFPPTRHPILWKWWFDYVLPKQMEKDKIDIFLSTDGYCSLNTNIPQILTIHDIAFEHFPEYIPFLHAKFMRYYTPKYIEKAAKIITVSEFSKQDIIQQYKLDSNKIEVVYNAFFEAQNDSQEYKFKINVPYFIFIGAIHPRKNVLNLIEAFEKFKQKTSSEFKMVLIGRDAWHNEEFKTNLRKSSVQKDIIWIEKINR